MLTGDNDFISQLTSSSLADSNSLGCRNSSFFVFYHGNFDDMTFNIDLICGGKPDDCNCSNENDSNKVDSLFLLTRPDYLADLNYGQDVALGSMIGITAENSGADVKLPTNFTNERVENLASYYVNIVMPYKSGDIRVDTDKLNFYHSVIDNENSPVSFYGYLQDKSEVLLNAVVEDATSRIFLLTKDSTGADIAYDNELNLVKVSVKDVDFNTLDEFTNGIKVSSESFKSNYNTFSVYGSLSRGEEASVYKLRGLPACFEDIYSAENVTTLMNANLPVIPFLLKYHVVSA